MTNVLSVVAFPAHTVFTDPTTVRAVEGKGETILKLPDFMQSIPYPVRLSPYTRRASNESDEFIEDNFNLSEERMAEFTGLNSGLLCGMCYPESGFEELRVCADIVGFLWVIDDHEAQFDPASMKTLRETVMSTIQSPQTYQSDAAVSRAARSWWLRLSSTLQHNCRRRFTATMNSFLQAVILQAKYHADNYIPDVEAYISLRRDTSGCEIMFALIEYTCGIDLPDEVHGHPTIKALRDAANDLGAWGNDIFSYNKEQSRGDSHNLIAVVMHTLGLARQPAIDYVGGMCMTAMERFTTNKAALPSWGAEVDGQVCAYVQGLEEMITANAEFCFMTDRYFGRDAPKVRKTLRVTLLSSI